ncbi:flagellar basal body-associated FliL family protein [Undibacterium sp. CCC3.4]|uniref:flagellar basal body-associated FliL family protein n=2 Tax=Undibacterium TaxID=401469 RepID=UPI002AC8E76F|nr:flagellar basal body-associated FliL family protein [Undibacterium sp. CCC3.4]WPX41897.1 flagellar basal body-associated FliL family protein [Undibacterium sp. CCC3.4]
MAIEKSKASLLSEKLDFEQVGELPQPAASQELDFFDMDLSKPAMLEAYLPSPPLAPVPEPVPLPAALLNPPPAPIKLLEPAVASKKNTPKPKKTAANDNFARYAAILTLCGLLLIFGSISYIRLTDGHETALAYLPMPQTVVTVDGQVIRMQLTLQVSNENKEWLFQNKAAFSQMTPVIMSKIDPDNLHTTEGFEIVREQLRTEFNLALHTDKIQSVLLDELLMQSN